MSVTTAFLALVLYPLIYTFPLNWVDFRWGLRRGLAPMPPELKARFDSVERIVQTARHFLLLAVIAFLLSDSTISVADIGFKLSNWRDLVSLGVFLGCLQSALSISFALRQPQRPGTAVVVPQPNGISVGIRLLSSVATIVWQAFCIVALNRVSFPAWAALLLTGVAIGLLQLHLSTARAIGAAAGGVVFGLIFVLTGSLVAPFTMALVGIAGNLYLGHVAYARKMARWPALECPLCAAPIDRDSAQDLGRTQYKCPNCGKQLKLALAKWQAQVIAWSCMALSLMIVLRSGLRFIWACLLFFALTAGFVLVCTIAVAIFIPGLQRLRLEDEPFRSTLFRI